MIEFVMKTTFKKYVKNWLLFSTKNWVDDDFAKTNSRPKISLMPFDKDLNVATRKLS